MKIGKQTKDIIYKKIHANIFLESIKIVKFSKENIQGKLLAQDFFELRNFELLNINRRVNL